MSKTLRIQLYSSYGTPCNSTVMRQWDYLSNNTFNRHLVGTLTASFTTHQYTYFVLKNTDPILLKLGTFYNNLLKKHLIYVNWVPSSVMNPPSLYQNRGGGGGGKCPKRQAYIRIPCQCEYPSLGFQIDNMISAKPKLYPTLRMNVMSLRTSCYAGLSKTCTLSVCGKICA